MQGNAQNITAGEYDNNEFYFDFIPNHILYAPAPINISSDSLYIDLNNDGVDDVILDVVSHNGGNWFNKKHAEVIPLNNCQIASGGIDTCFANCPPPNLVSFEASAKAFDSTEIINASTNWIDSVAYLSFFRHEAAIPNNCGYSCWGGNFEFVYKYIGVRVFSANDTLYGWIKTKQYTTVPGDYNIVIESFACNTYVVGLEEISLPQKYLIRTIDLLGRETEDKPNTLLIYQYSDGTFEKVFRLE